MKIIYDDRKVPKLDDSNLHKTVITSLSNYSCHYELENSNSMCMRLKYNYSADYLPISVMINKPVELASGHPKLYNYSAPLAKIKQLLFLGTTDYMSNMHCYHQVRGDRNGYQKLSYFSIDKFIYCIDNGCVYPLLGILIKNNISNRVSIRKDKALNDALYSMSYDIPMDSLLFVDKNLLVKGHLHSFLGVKAKQLMKKYDFLETTDDIGIFDDIFDHKIKPPKSFAEFEEFNSKVSTQLKQNIDKYYD